MSRKYIRQIINQDFVYANNEVSEYDIELVQDLNNISVSGSVNSFSATTVSSTGITFSLNYTWLKNGTDTFDRNSTLLRLLSVHMLASNQNYFKPWRTVNFVTSANLNLTSQTATVTFTVTPSQLGLTSFANGMYYFEFRFIGEKAIFPISLSRNITTIGPTPTPTPTVTPSGPTPTPTATPTPTPTVTASPGGISLQVYARDIATSRQTITMFYKKNGGGNINIPGATATQLPASCTYLTVITGLTAGDTIEFGTDIGCVMTGQSNSTSCPSALMFAPTFIHNVDAPTTQVCAITIDSQVIY